MSFYHKPRKISGQERRRSKKIYYLIVDDLGRYQDAGSFKEASYIRANWKYTLQSPEIQKVTIEVAQMPAGSILHWPVPTGGNSMAACFTACKRFTVHIAGVKKQVSCIDCLRIIRKNEKI